MMATLNGYRSSLKNSNVTINCTGIVSNNNLNFNNNFKVYPNPSNGKITIQTNNPKYNITIKDIIGQTIYKEIDLLDNETLDITFLTNGIYLININYGNNNTTKRIIINK
jgi:extracellular elastinolytic metalloproteinase